MSDPVYSDLLALVLEGSKKYDLVSAALQEAVPVLRQMLSGECRLKSARELDHAAARDSIALATGRPARRIVPVSRARLREAGHACSDQLRRNINGTSLCDRLIDRHAASLWKGLSSIDRYRLFRRLSDLDRPAAPGGGGSPWPVDDFGLSIRVRSCVEEGLYMLLGQAMAGNRRQFKKLVPLCRMLPSFIPLGEHKDEPGTWFILVA